MKQKIWKYWTCIQVSSIRSGEFSGDESAGGNGWISFGTTTRSLPNTKIAPALLAVPASTKKKYKKNPEKYLEKR